MCWIIPSQQHAVYLLVYRERAGHVMGTKHLEILIVNLFFRQRVINQYCVVIVVRRAINPPSVSPFSTLYIADSTLLVCGQLREAVISWRNSSLSAKYLPLCESQA